MFRRTKLIFETFKKIFIWCLSPFRFPEWTLQRKIVPFTPHESGWRIGKGYGRTLNTKANKLVESSK
jgi:hypothetical protein